MRAYAPLLLIPILLIASAFRGDGSQAEGAAEAEVAPSPPSSSPSVHVIAGRTDLPDSLDLDGVLVPAGAVEMTLRPAEWGGELRFVEVVPHGSFVNAGDVVARLDLEGIDEAIEAAEYALGDLERAHLAAKERAAIAEAGEAGALADARAALTRAERSLEGWKKVEQALAERGRDLSDQFRQHSIEDAEDELAQLEAMYRDDELVDATEEIVLKRSRRDLASQKAGQKLSADQRDYDREYEAPGRTEVKVEAVARARRAVDKLEKTQAIDRRERAAGLAKAERAVTDKGGELTRLKADRESMTVVAPRDGVLLHGGLDDWRRGRASAVHAKGGRVAAREGLFVFAEPDRLEVALAVPESKRASVKAGMAARVRPIVARGTEHVGSLRVATHPSAASAAALENTYDATVSFDGKLVGLVAGMRAKVSIETGGLENVLLLPRSAVFGGDAPHVWLATGEEETYRRVAVTLGAERGGEVVVEGELAEGARVLLGETAE